jgi:carboxylate-amine ligase
MLKELGPKLRRQLVCGLHVHVGMESFEACLRTLAAIVPWLPDVLALSLNSPYIQGAETGSLSARAARLGELPRGAQPPYFASPEDWKAYIESTGKDYTRSWWDARPHPRLGTIEVRIPDQPTEVVRSAALAALVQALCVAAPAPAERERDSYPSRRAAAARHGEARTAELLALVEPAARELGTWDLVEELRKPPEALRQLETGRRDGLEAVVAELVERTAA